MVAFVATAEGVSVLMALAATDISYNRRNEHKYNQLTTTCSDSNAEEDGGRREDWARSETEGATFNAVVSVT